MSSSFRIEHLESTKLGGTQKMKPSVFGNVGFELVSQMCPLATAQCGLPIVLLSRLQVPVALRPFSGVSFILYILAAFIESPYFECLTKFLELSLSLSCVTLLVSHCLTLIQSSAY